MRYPMFDPVTDEALRRRRQGATFTSPPEEPVNRTSLICSVCAREIRAEEEFYWVSEEVHCYQCHSMLDFELVKEREADKEMRETGTRWKNGSKD